MTNIARKSTVYSDVESRSRNGAFIYFAVWAIAGYGTGFVNSEPTIYYNLCIAFASLGAIRIVITRLRKKTRLISTQVWIAGIYFNTLVPASLTSTLFAISIVSETFSPVFQYLMIAVFAMISGGIAIFSPQAKLLFSYVAVLIIPPISSSVYYSSEYYIEAILLVVYAVYMLALSKILRREYEQRINHQIEIERLNNIDSLTGVCNRRAFDKRTNHEWLVSSRAKQFLSLLVIDIDKFKLINDNYGHSAGDEVIKETAKAISAVFKRKTECVARIGGEEFAIIVTLDTHSEIVKLGEEARKSIENTAISWEGIIIKFTVSIGVATCIPCHTSKYDELFNLADKCLYLAKNNGRNQVVSETLNYSK